MAARLKAFLEADDETDGGGSVTSPSSKTKPRPDARSSVLKSTSADVGVVSAAPAGLKLASASTSVAPASSLSALTAPTTQSVPSPAPLSAPDPICVNKSSSTKTVSFAPLPKPGMLVPSQLPTLSSLTSSTPVSSSQITANPGMPLSNQLPSLACSAVASGTAPQITANPGMPLSNQLPSLACSAVASGTAPQIKSTGATKSDFPGPLSASLPTFHVLPASQPLATSSQPLALASSAAISQPLALATFQPPAPLLATFQPLAQVQGNSGTILMAAPSTSASTLAESGKQPGSLTLANSLFKMAQPATAQVSVNPVVQGQGSQLLPQQGTTTAAAPSFLIPIPQTNALSSTGHQTTQQTPVNPASQPIAQAPMAFSQTSAGQTPQLSLFGKSSLPKGQSSLLIQNTQPSSLLNQSAQLSTKSSLLSQNAQPSTQSSLFTTNQLSLFKQSAPQLSLNPPQPAQSAMGNTKLTSQPLNFNFSAGSASTTSGVPPGVGIFGGPAVTTGNTQGSIPFGGLTTSGNSQGGTTGFFGGMKTAAAHSGNSQGGTMGFFGGMKTAAANSGNTQVGSTGPTLFGGLQTAGGNTPGGSTGPSLFGGQPQTGSTRGSVGLTLFGGLQPNGSNTMGGVSGPTLFGSQQPTAPGGGGSTLFGGLKASSGNAQGRTGHTLIGGSQTTGATDSTLFGGIAGTGFQFSATNQQGTGSGIVPSAPQNMAGLNNIFNPEQSLLKGLSSSQTNPLTKTAAGGGIKQQSSFQFGGDTKNKSFEFGAAQQSNTVFAGESQPVMFQAGSFSAAATTSTPRKAVRGRRRTKK